MDSPETASAENKHKQNTLVVDKEGRLGSALAEKFAEKTITVLVSQKQANADSSVINIPFTETVPAIPDGIYSYIVYVFDAQTKDLLEPIMKKASQDNAHFLIVVGYLSQPLLSEYLSGKERYGHIVVVGDIFGRGDGEIDEWLYQIKKTKKILLKHMGLNAWYPVFSPDVTQSLVDLCISPHREKEIYLLASLHPITQFTLAHALQKTDPFLRIDFGENGKQTTALLPEGKHLLHEHAVIEELKTYYLRLVVKEEPDTNISSFFTSLGEHSKSKKGKPTSLLFVLYTLLIFAIMPGILMVTTGLLGKWLLVTGINDIEHNALPQALQKVRAANTNIAFSQFSEGLVERELSLVGQSYRLNVIKEQLTLGQVITTTLTQGIDASQKIQGVILGKSLHPEADSEEGANELQSMLLIVQKLQTYNLPQQYRDKLSLFKIYDPFIETLTGNLPQLLGSNTERKYLILFQNNTELRPGGGFIGSYGLLTLSHGKFKNFSIHDVYDADGQLKGHVEPPFAIRRYLPSAHLYLRDSNFDIDFTKNAQKVAFMLNAETGEKVDGVVGVDLSLVKNIIGSLGSIYVPSYSETVTPDNFFLLTEKHAEKNSFAGSTQKKDFLSALFSALQDKLFSAKGDLYSNVSQALLNGLEEKHLLMTVADPSVQTSFAANGFSSALMDSREIDESTLNDFFGINEANLGIDKVNYFVTRKVDQKVIVTDKGQVQERVTLQFENNSTGQWPGGDYKNYLRFILPKGTSLTNLTINGKDQKIVPAVTDPTAYEAKTFRPPQGLEVEQTEESGKSIFGFLVMIPVKTTSTITIAYTLPTTVDLTQSLPVYSLQLFKQPGIDDVPYSLEATYPQGYSLLKSSEQMKNTGNTVSLTKDIQKDIGITVSFIKK